MSKRIIQLYEFAIFIKIHNFAVKLTSRPVPVISCPTDTQIVAFI